MPSAQRVIAVAIALSLSVFGAIAIGASRSSDKAGSAASTRDPCGAPDHSVTAHYPVSGYWIFPGRDRCDVRGTVQGIHRIGGDTVITTGPGLETRLVDIDGRLLTEAGTVDADFRDCVDGGRTCYQAALDTLRKGNSRNSIVQIYALPTSEALGPSLVRCPGRDSRITVGDRIYHRILLPAGDPSSTSCDISQGGPFRLILIEGSATDWLAAVLGEADRFGMQAFVGMPIFPGSPQRTWKIDPGHLDTTLALTRLVLQDYARRFGHHKSFTGLYQGFELRLADWPDPAKDPNLRAYAAQHSLAHELMAGKKILVSPYWDARHRIDDETSPAVIATAVKSIARTGADIIAPQDGRGTGKGAFFWDHQAKDPVDARLRPVAGVGDSTNEQAFSRQTAVYYRASARARDAFARERGPAFELWANVEAFEPTAPTKCDADTARGRTDKARLDQALTFAGTNISKIVSFKWNGLYTCRADRPMSLSEEITADWNRPILSGAVRWRSNGREGLLIHGYQLKGSTVTLTWYDSGWTRRTRAISVDREGNYNPLASIQIPRLPQHTEEVWVPFAWTDMAPDFWIHTDIKNSTGKSATHRFSLRYH